MMKVTVAYGMTERVDLSHERAVAVVTEALRNEGFGVLTTIDVRKTMWEKLGEEMPDYVILGACNPTLAYMALRDEIDVGLLLPCNVVVRTDPEDEKTVVSIQNPMIMSELTGSHQIEKVAGLAREKLERVLAEVKGVAP
ncbi:MAG TPA: DUF302 domain-containing protein [Dehalococcoidia bacterium]|nr:DUF302 domain-containing protein [Dehalococcoidia bacterium]